MTVHDKPGERYWRTIDPVWDELMDALSDGPEAFESQLQRTDHQGLLLAAAHLCQSEVRNGGFHQFFSNSSGLLAPEALEAFRTMELTEWASILKKAMGFFGPTYPRDRSQRQSRLLRPEGLKREQSDPFLELDDQFYAWLHEKKDRWEIEADAYATRRAQ